MEGTVCNMLSVSVDLLQGVSAELLPRSWQDNQVHSLTPIQVFLHVFGCQWSHADTGLNIVSCPSFPPPQPHLDCLEVMYLSLNSLINQSVIG